MGTEARTQRGRLASLTAVPLAAATILRLKVGGPPLFPFDDAYISIHSARYLFDRVDPSFGSSPLNGATSLLHVALLRGFMTLGLAPVWACEALCWLAASLYFLGLAKMLTRLGRPMDQALLLALGAGIGYTPMHLWNGQETGLALAACVWSIVALSHDTRDSVAIPALAGVMSWLRPDLLPAAAFLLFFRLRSAPEHRIRDGSIVFAAIVLWCGTNVLTVGTMVPNSLSAKRYFFGAYAAGWTFTIATMLARAVEYLALIGPASLGLLIAWRDRAGRLMVAVAVLQFVAIGLASSVSLDHNYFRYLHPVSVPVMIVGLIAMNHMAVKFVERLLWYGVVGSSVLMIALQASGHWADFRNAEQQVASQEAIGEWLTKNSDGRSVLIHDAGFLSEATTLRFVDLVGLKTAAAIELHRTLTGPSGGGNRGEAEHLLACQTDPKFFVALTIWERAFEVSDGLKRAGWQLTEVFRTHFDDRIWGPSGYVIYELTRSPRC